MRELLRTAALVTLAAAAWTIASAAEAAEATTFAITIRNVSTAGTLKLANGKTTAAPIAPGLYAIVRGDAKLFTSNQASGHSLEALAEDGDAVALLAAIKVMDGVVAADMLAPDCR